MSVIATKHKGFIIESKQSTNYKGLISNYYYCKVSDKETRSTNTLKDMIDYIDYITSNQEYLNECSELNHKAMISFYSDRDKYLYNE